MIDTLYSIFREKWSNGRGCFLVSDTHFSDEDRHLMGYDITEEEQIAVLKKYVNGQTLIHLGDVGNPEYLKELNCYKVLIMGNHDERVGKFKDYFDEIYTGPLFIAEKLVLSHEPICVEAGITRNPIAFNIHGHDHSGEYYNDDYHLNICQNVFGYEPLNLKEFIKDGILKSVKSIHREIIDNATNKKKEIKGNIWSNSIC